MKSGRTIAGERERIETASERMAAREKANKKRKFSVVIVGLIGVILVISGVVLWQEFLVPEEGGGVSVETDEKVPTVEIVDEAGTGVSSRVREYVAYLEEDLGELGYTMSLATLPQDKTREVLVRLAGREGYYFKVNIDRGTGVTAEDIDRMVRYLDQNGIVPEYVDVRVAGKAFYK